MVLSDPPVGSTAISTTSPESGPAPWKFWLASMRSGAGPIWVHCTPVTPGGSNLIAAWGADPDTDMCCWAAMPWRYRSGRGVPEASDSDRRNACWRACSCAAEWGSAIDAVPSGGPAVWPATPADTGGAVPAPTSTEPINSAAPIMLSRTGRICAPSSAVVLNR